VITYIDAYRERFGVEPICRTLQFAPSTYWSDKSLARHPAPLRDRMANTSTTISH